MKNFIVLILYLITTSSIAQTNQKEHLEALRVVSDKINNGRMDEAVSQLDVLSKKNTYQNDLLIQAKHYGLNGLILEIQGEFQNAEKYYFKALKKYRLINNYEGIFSIYNSMGILSRKLGNLDTSLDYYKKSLLVAPKTNNKRFEAIANINISVLYRHRAQYQEAIRYVFDGLKIMEELEDTLGILTCKGNLGILYENLKQYDDANNYYNEVYSYSKKNNNLFLLNSVTANLASIYHLQGHHTQALKFNLKSLDFSQELQDYEGICSSYIGISNNYFRLNQSDSALFYSKKAMNIAKKKHLIPLLIPASLDYCRVRIKQNEMKGIELILDSVCFYIRKNSLYADLGAYYEIRKDFHLTKKELELALHYFDSILIMQDSSYHKNLHSQFLREEIKIKTKKLKTEKLNLIQEIQEKNNSFQWIITFTITLIILICLISILLLVRHRKKKSYKTIELIELISQVTSPALGVELSPNIFETFDEAYPKFEKRVSHSCCDVILSDQEINILKLIFIDSSNYQIIWILDKSKGALKTAKSRLRSKLVLKDGEDFIDRLKSINKVKT